MQIQKCGKSVLANIMASELPPKEEQLDGYRKDHGLTDETVLPTDGQLSNERKDEDLAPYEKLLRSHEIKHAPNADKSGTTEQRLNSASKDFYPHRNPEAYERTGDKRPINALPEELGTASDEAKNKRYDKASKVGPERILDKDVGSQKSAFNLRQTRIAAKCNGYVEYKHGVAGIVVAKNLHADIKTIDSTMASIMHEGLSRPMTDDEKAQIVALKRRKTELLNRA